MRELLTALARKPAVRKTAMSTPGLRNLAWRFVAGENLEAGLEVVATACLVDREEGAAEALKGYRFKALFTMRELLEQP